MQSVNDPDVLGNEEAHEHRWSPWAGEAGVALRKRECFDCGYIQTDAPRVNPKGRSIPGGRRITADDRRPRPQAVIAKAKSFGTCPQGGGTKWFDNRPAKKSGRYKSSAPDAKCTTCRWAIWPERSDGPRL